MKQVTPSSSIKRILIIRFSSIGDIVLTTPVIRGLARKFPGLQIDFLIKRQFKELIAHHPAVDTVHTIPGDLPLRDLLQLRNRLLEEGRYDFILDLHDNLRSKILTWNSPVPFARYQKNRFHRWLFIYWKIRTPQVEKYITDRYFETVQPWGISDDEAGLDFYFPEDFTYHSQDLAARAAEFHAASLPVSVAPGAAWPTKEWMPERFADTCEHLIEQQDATIGLLGGPAEVEIGRWMESRISRPERVFNFIGTGSLMESARILQGARFHLANDSGFTHIATAFHKPVVVIYGPTAKPTVFHPRYTRHEIVEDPTLRCRPCTHMGRKQCPLGHFRCMKNVQVADVLAACRRVIAS